MRNLGLSGLLVLDSVVLILLVANPFAEGSCLIFVQNQGHLPKGKKNKRTSSLKKILFINEREPEHHSVICGVRD